MRKAVSALGAVAALATLGVCSSPVIASAAPQAPAPVQARPADSLVDMMGVNVHLIDKNTTYKDFALVEQRLQGLGVRHVRDHLGVNRTDQLAMTDELYSKGIDTDFIVSKTINPHDLPQRMQWLSQFTPGSIAAVEPPNEWNLSGDRHWGPDIRDYTEAMSSAVRATPALGGSEILGPSLAQAQNIGFGDVGNLASFITDGNVHLYPGGRTPDHNMAQVLTGEQEVSGDLPQVVTEAGFHDALNSTSTHPATSDAAEAVYEPRLWLDYFNRGTHRVYQYELLDDHNNPSLTQKESHFGLVQADGTPRLDYYAMRNLIKLVNDHGQQIANPGSLSYSVDAGATPVEQTLVQRADGSFVLFLWRDDSVWDWQTEQAINVPSVPVTVQFAQPMGHVTAYRPTYAMTPQASFTNRTSITMPLHADVVALVINPS